MPVNALSLTISEVLQRANGVKKLEDKVKILRENNSLALRDILKVGFDDTVALDLPEGAPVYKKNSKESIPSTLHKQTPKFKYFVKGNIFVQPMPKAKLENMFIGILESIDPDDAELVVKAKDKKISELYPRIPKKTVMEAFPGLIRA